MIKLKLNYDLSMSHVFNVSGNQ